MKPPSPDPWYKARLPLAAGALRLELEVPHDVFSTLRVDEGTLLLLAHLPAAAPARVLDLGCGYGALGLPVAARFPAATVELVDRDLLATTWAARNAARLGLGNARVHPSLGYRDLDPGLRPYDWVLCNVPARIGRPFIAHLLAAGRARLAPGGELRVVVIRDLGPLVEALRDERGWPLVEAGRGPRHVVYALPAQPGPAEPVPEPAALYGRDEVELGGLRLERPFDLGGDDPRRLVSGLPVLLDVLPRAAPARALAFRCGYGALPLTARTRWPQAQVVAVDRDLLATAFTRGNAARLGLSGPLLEVREAAHLPDALGAGERFDLVAGELSPSAGARVAEAELLALSGALAPKGQGLLLALDKIARDWLLPGAARHKLSLLKVVARDGYTLLRLAPR